MAALRIYTDVRRIIAIDVLSLVFGVIFVFLLSRIRMLLSPPVSIALIAILAVSLAADVLIRAFKGLRAVQVDGKGLLLERGRLPDVTRVRRDEITRVRVRRFPGKKLVITVRAPGRKLLPGVGGSRRIRIRDNAFSREDFDRLIAAAGRLPTPA
jgi:hypothetical protein